MVDLKKFFNNSGFNPAPWTGLSDAIDATGTPTPTSTPHATATHPSAATAPPSAAATPPFAAPRAATPYIPPWGALPAAPLPVTDESEAKTPPPLPTTLPIPEPLVDHNPSNTVVNTRAGRPRKYDFGPVDDATYKMLARKETLRLSHQKRKTDPERNIVLPVDLTGVNHTPAPDTPDPVLQGLYTDYINKQGAIEAGIKAFQQWIILEAEKTEAARVAYINHAVKLRYGNER